MEYLYAPWRKAYFTQKMNTCVFCDVSENEKDDEENMVLFRDSKCFGIMNLFPYSPGHFMIIPYLHSDNVENLDTQTWLQMSLHVRSGIKMLKEHFGASGVNIGMNLGIAGGAGISEHVHYHLVPRHQRDTNFITSIGGARVNGIEFTQIYHKLKSAVPKYFELEKNK